MFNISAYLEKFKNFGQGARLQKEVIINAVEEVVGQKIESKNVTVKNGEIFLKVSPGLKSVIFIKKEEILNKIKENKTGNITTIR